MFDTNAFPKRVKVNYLHYDREYKKKEADKVIEKKVYKILELVARALSIVGTVLLASLGNITEVRLGVFICYLIASIMLVIYSKHKKMKWIMISQIVFVISAVIGIVSNILLLDR